MPMKWEIAVPISSATVFAAAEDVQYEIPYGPAPGEVGTTIVGGQVVGNRSDMCGQAGIALIGCPDWAIVRNRMTRPAQASAPILGYLWPGTAGIIISSRCERVVLAENWIVDLRNSKAVKRTDGAITVDTTTFVSAGASFTDADIGKEIGIVGAGPDDGDIPHIAYIASRTNGTTVVLDRPALKTVSGATFVYGGACRVGISITAPVSVKSISGVIRAGIHSGISGEPDAFGLYIDGIDEPCSIHDLTVIAPTTAGTTPRGIEIGGNMTEVLAIDWRSVDVSGYTYNLSSFYAFRIGLIAKTRSFPEDRAIAPSATANTYGSGEALSATLVFTDILRGSVEAVGSFGGGETVTFQLAPRFHGADGTAISYRHRSRGPAAYRQAPKALNPERRALRAVTVQMKSSASSSSVTGKIN